MSIAPVVYKSIEVNKLTEPLVDLGNLLLVDRDSIDDTVDGEKKAQKLSDEDFLNMELPRKQVDSAICAQLPEGTYRLPREKPVPEKREPTKWEKFAREKGIVSQKKGNRKVWDDTAQDWNRVMDIIPDQKDPYKDYFEERKQEKKERVNKNEVQRLRNIGRSMKSSGGSGSNFVPLGQQLNGPQTPKQASRELTEQMHRAKNATASVGKFQDSLKGEKKAKLGEKRKFGPNESGIVGERQHQLEILDKLQSKKPKLSEAKFNAAAEHTVAEQRRNGEINENGEERRKKKSSMRRSNAGLASKYAGKANMHRQQHFNKTRSPVIKVMHPRLERREPEKQRKALFNCYR
uniref:Ribosome biogenesis regulatory protein n=1 Tax=Ditylenchus dipsaci TaxID=166011 RepID=A0A915E2A9_9BILA